MVALSPVILTLEYGASAALGLAAGVGVSALADRVAGDEDPPLRGDQCPSCRKPLPPGRLWPLAEIWLLRGRCPACGAAVSLRRLGVDVALLLAFPLLLAHALAPGTRGQVAPGVLFTVDAIVASVLALIFVIDLEHHLILDAVVYPTAAALVVTALVFDHKALASMLLGAVISGGLFLGFYGLGFLIYREEALGFGDVKLAALVGVAVGWPGIISALVIAALFGFAISVMLLGLGRVTTRTYVPFGTFLSLGGALALLVAVPVWH